MTALDSNVLSILSSQNPAAKAAAMSGFETAAGRGLICICGPVFAELLGLPGRDAGSLERWLVSLGIAIEWTLDEADWKVAGTAYQGYVGRRRASSGGLPRLMLTDFLIGAHAVVRNYTLFTFDKRLYEAAYPRLRISIL
jgi:predicted nucleic acid-binding protein